MKQLACEICGSTELLKQDGIFVCQSCGTKYSLEEAKNLMKEDFIEPENSSHLEKHLANARTAKQNKDWQEAEKYYTLARETTPENVEAIFYAPYSRLRAMMLEVIESGRSILNMYQVFCNSILQLADYFDVEKAEENHRVLSQMNDDLFDMYRNSKEIHKTYYGRTTNINSFTPVAAFSDISVAFIEALEKAATIDDRFSYDDMLLSHCQYIADHLRNEDIRVKYEKKASSLLSQVKKSNPSYVVKNEVDELKRKSGGCYVATAVYGSYDCPQVWTLRRYRDYTLAETWQGRAFIRTYYTISPTLVKWFGDTSWFKKMWKGKLDRMVEKLQSEGFEDTPYRDKQW